jgi:hypothetical protein
MRTLKLNRAVPAFVFSLLWMACAVRAQVQVQPPTRPPQAQDGGTREVLESIAIPPLVNAPFTGTLVTEWTRPMADGGSYTLTNHRRIARDSAGRIYEERWLLVPKGSDIKSSMNFIQIADPVNRTLATCSTVHKRCDLSAYRPSASAAFEDDPPPPGRSKDGAHTVENLGAGNLFGLDTIGTRQITTIPQGTVGNDRPIQIVLEFWHSTRLGFNLESLRSDPRLGTQKFTITELDTVDPDPQLFRVPEGYQVVDQQTNPPVAW